MKFINDGLPALRAANPTSSSKLFYYFTINKPNNWSIWVHDISIGQWNSSSDISMVEGVFYDYMTNDNELKVQGKNITLTKITLKK